MLQTASVCFFNLGLQHQRKDSGGLEGKGSLTTVKATVMCGRISGIIKAAFITLLALCIRTILNQSSPARAWLSLTYSRLTRPITGGLAPRINCHASPNLLDKDEYSIILKYGHTMEEHKLAVGRAGDSDAVTRQVFDYPFPDFQVTYFARDKDGDPPDAIQADPGVDLVGCDIVQEVDLAVSRDD